MGNRDDDRLGQLNLQSCEGSYRTSRGPRQLHKRKDCPGRSRYPPGAPACHDRSRPAGRFQPRHCCGAARADAQSRPTRRLGRAQSPTHNAPPNKSTRSARMRVKDRLYLSGAAIALAAVLAAAPAELRAQTAVAIDNDDIGGVVTGASGPEAGVWVIAETTDLPTRYAKMVVTDDQGRYVVPDLPKAKYKVWVRGYGLVDSPKVDGEPGKQLDLKAVAAPNEADGGAILSGDLLVLDAEDPGRQRVRQEGQRYSRQDHPGRVAQRDQEPGLRRLSPARPALHPHDPGGVRRVQVGRGRLAPPHHVGPGRPADDQSARRLPRRRAVSIFRRLDRSRRQGRAAARQAAAAARASSATWSSPPGTGATRSSISTT